MKEDIAHYRRVGPGHPDHTYEYLMKCLNHHLVEEREDRNMKAIENSLQKGGEHDPALAGTTVCPFHLKGKCKKGKDCDMSHAGPPGKGKAGDGGKGKKGAPPGKGGEGGKDAGKGKKGAPPGKGGKAGWKQYPCYMFQDGKCKHQANPEKCKWDHRPLTAEEKKSRQEYTASRTASPAPSSQGAQAETCPAWLNGDCPLGKKCKNKHPKNQKGKNAKPAES